MRRVTVASCLLATIGCVTMLSACSGSEPAPPKTAKDDGTVRLTLTSDADGNLRLDGTPSDPGYVGIYANPDRWSSIEFLLGDDAIPVARCTRDGVQLECTETPFFVEVRRNVAAVSTGDVHVRTFGVPAGSVPPPPPEDEPAADSTAPTAPAAPAAPSAPAAPAVEDKGVTVTVTDVHGKEVATKTTSGTAPATSPTAPAGSTCGGAAVGGSPGQGGFSKSGSTRACEAASLADTPGCDGTTVAAAAKVYCDSVNAQLPAADKIDCSVLTSGSYVPGPLPESRSGGDCSTYWEPARAAVDAAGHGDCMKVDLLLTQWRDRARHELIGNGVCRSSPLVLDLDGDGIHLSALAEGVKFDLLGGGQKVWSAWTDGKDALLALDRDGNGQIDGAAELFGNATAGGSYADGFAALAELDDDGNGAIDARDRAFGHLVVWRDADRDGTSTPRELMTLAEAGIKRLSIVAVRRDGPSSLDGHGNAIPLVTEFERTNGTRGALVDAFFRFKPVR
jgi:hypothetical protein